MNNIKRFIGDSILKYAKTGKKLLFDPATQLKDGDITFTGCADENGIQLAIGGKPELWTGVFVHETCHLDQATERPRWFGKCSEDLNSLDEWLKGKEVGNIRKIIHRIIDLEYDCEERSIAKIKKHKLEMSIKVYSQKANAYLLGYSATLKNRVWTEGPYDKPEIYTKLPPKLMPIKQIKNPDWEALGLQNMISSK